MPDNIKSAENKKDNYEYRSTADEVLNSGGGPLKSYMQLVAGTDSFLDLLKYELVTGLLSSCPGGIGYLLRQKIYPGIMGGMGRGVGIGKNVSIRGPKRVFIGRNVIIEGNCIIYARGENARIVIEDNVIIAANTMIRSRGEKILIRDGSSIGANCIIGTDSNITIGKNVLIAAFCYLSGGGAHNHGDTTVPIIKQGVTRKGGITVGDGAWIGAHTTVLDGANIGNDSIIGSNSLINKDVPPMSIAFGTPAKVVSKRGE